MHMDVESRRTVRLSGKLIAVNRPPARCEDVIFVTSTFHMSMESSFETQFKVVLLKTDPEHHFPDPHSFKLSNRTDNLNDLAHRAHKIHMSGVVPEVGGTPSMPTVRCPLSGELPLGRRSSRSALDQ